MNGHSSSQILDLYYYRHDDGSQAAMRALVNDTFMVRVRIVTFLFRKRSPRVLLDRRN